MSNVECRMKTVFLHSTFFIRHSTFKSSSIKPVSYIPARVDVRSPPPVRPAHVRDTDEVRRREAVLRADLAGEERGVAAESHRSDAALVRLADDAFLEVAQQRIGVRVVELAEELFLRVRIAGSAVAADADAEDAGAAALALRVEDALEDGVLDALQIAAAELRIGERVLRVHVLA